ncbi:hypothetical protein ERO13_A03G121500v2 [Gossypium hirsutum]|nr:hypothetical protein ERO13_A03G121500v2 [Gossypium hirsutum]
MTSWGDLYTVLTAVIPLYVAMILAYGSCLGINRFVAIFAVPLLSFHFISTNDLYAINFMFIAPDTLQKLIMLFALGLWANFTKNGSLEWMITIFSLSTLPNTFVMGIPLLIAMYDEYSGMLMVQVVVLLQCIIWYTFLLFLFEYRGAKMLIMEQFPETAASIVSFKVDSDVVSLDGRVFLQTDAEIGEDEKLHVVVRKSNASRRPSNLTGAEIYILSSSRNPTPKGSNFNNSDFYSMMGIQGFPARQSTFGPTVLYSVQSSREPTPIPFNFEENSTAMSSRFGFYLAQSAPSSYPAQNSEFSSLAKNAKLHMFVWSSSTLLASEGDGLHVFGGADFGASKQSGRGELDGENFGFARRDGEDERENGGPNELNKLKSNSKAELHPKAVVGALIGGGKQMPLASVMTRLILIMKSISILSDAGLGMAMFSLGLFMALQPKLITCGNSVATFAMAVKFLIGPAVMAASSIVVGLRGTLLCIAIVQAVLPQGIPFVFTKEYNVHPAILSTAVIFGMLIALSITLVYYILLGL